VQEGDHDRAIRGFIFNQPVDGESGTTDQQQFRMPKFVDGCLEYVKAKWLERASAEEEQDVFGTHRRAPLVSRGHWNGWPFDAADEFDRDGLDRVVPRPGIPGRQHADVERLRADHDESFMGNIENAPIFKVYPHGLERLLVNELGDFLRTKHRMLLIGLRE
jgi:hypothetical protein